MIKQSNDAQHLVQVSGRGTLVNLRIEDSVPVEDACEALQQHLRANRHLYARGDVAMDIGRRILRENEKASIAQTVEAESGLTVKRFLCDPEILEQERRRITNLLAAQAGFSRKNEAVGDGAENTPATLDAVAYDPGDHTPDEVLVGGLAAGGERYGVPALVVRGTCRAGEVIRHAGNLVVLGNVNPGAQVIAGGDIVVFGGLRGLAHAGCDGDATATVLAMSIANPSLRIAGYAWTGDAGYPTPSNAGRRANNGTGASIARVANGAIHVAPYFKNFAINHGGNPNER